jgi:phospholipid/cholesterol/gamma-HCH transport system substrate-binding protein
VRGHTLSAFVKLVIFAVITIIATAILGVTISNRTFGPTHSYKADFTDVTGLLAGDSVRAAGVRVGTVQSISVVNDRYARVSFSVDTNVPVYTTTHFAVRYLNLVGQRYIALIDAPGETTRQPTGAVIGLARTAPALDLTQLFNGFRPLFSALTPSDVNSFALEVIKTLQGETGTITDLVAKSATLTNTVADRDAVVGDLVNNLVNVLGTVAARDQGLDQLVTQLQRLVSGLASQRDTISASLTNIDDLASNSALLLQQIRPFLPSDITNLGAIANTLNTTKDCPGYLSSGRDNPTKESRFATNSCSGPNTLQAYLQHAPTKIIQIIRTATYGQWFNFYLCDMQLTGELATVLEQAGASPNIAVNVPACHL